MAKVKIKSVIAVKYNIPGFTFASYFIALLKKLLTVTLVVIDDIGFLIVTYNLHTGNLCICWL